jgi:1-acyl-sn-glycerol-3-phosphate acyltransferase
MIRATFAFLMTSLVMAIVCTVLVAFGVFYPSHRVVALGSYLFARTVLVCSGVRLTVAGFDPRSDAKPRFFVGNHQSALDIPILLTALRGRVRFMAKKSLFRIPLFGWAMSLYGYAPIDRSDARATVKTLAAMVERVRRRPVSFLVFPEGTRNADGGLLPFRKGAMKICRRAGLDVVPFTINGSAGIQRPREFRLRPGSVRLEFASPIPADEVAGMTTEQLHDQVRKAIEGRLNTESSE